MKRDEQTPDGARPEFLTARQLAAVLQVSESTVRRLAREGRIPAVRVTPHLLRFRLDAVVEALDGSRRARPSRRQDDSQDGADDTQLTFPELL
ncbi:MAG TPA: helix-turn-helix domain-containing protein [Pyrinomonadaceae bacterium]|nr:helix-turn-helix domain-containing protein [Pyrinomonadaceae bacterium]